MYSDSFGIPLIRMIAPHFSEAAFMNNNQAFYLSPLTFSAIDKTAPNVVILEFAERNLDQLFNFLRNYDLDAMQ
jgi:hypothetical protein